jgi:hypothetical protein
METNFFFSKPPCELKFGTVSEVQDKMVAFNAMYEIGDTTSAACKGPEFAAQWRKAVRHGVINCAGTAIEMDFFRNVAGGMTEDIDATDYYIKTNCDVDYNIMTEADADGSGPGAEQWITIARSLHTGSGKYSNIVEGGSIYNYREERWMYVREVDRTVDYAHRARVIPEDGTWELNVKAGEAMMFNPAKIVGGTSCPSPSVTWMSNGYISKIQPLRIRKDWKIPKELDRAYRDVMQFALIFDNATGEEIPSWEYKAKITTREEIVMRENLEFFIGQKITNPAMLGTDVDSRFGGFTGYLPTIKYNGGVVYDYAKSQGFSLKYDFTPIMLRQDARKKSSEFMVLAALPFLIGLQNRGDIDFNKVPGACTFETFQRYGTDMEDIKKLGIKSFVWGNYSMHYKEAGFLSDQRTLGHGAHPYMAMMMPGNGLRDSDGRSVPPIEFFKPKGYEYTEQMRDFEKIDGCEYIGGHIIKTIMAATHCPDSHILINPQDY